MKKTIVSLAVVLASLGGYWLWRNKERLEAEAHQHGVDDRLKGKAMQVKGAVTNDSKDKLKGDFLAGRGEFKDWLVAVKCDAKK
ncbi:hypothetical protein [Lactiplantibacillus daowaiensis]|uniref:CsbD family protein n=1 Tax=Lactiplantibacillus daowaiensis TaxID=2559918 RepID=A0ABW1RXM4_9LACO|nr:hypothetical protein [Lactiplantibacillus daowaiensis]